MKHLYKAFLLLFFVPFFSEAQSNYKPGYAVTLKGDTLHGYIDYREWDTNPHSINFKTSLSETRDKKLGPDEISYFNIDNLESYQRYAGLISMDRTDATHIGGKDSTYKAAVVFLKILQKGNRLTVYAYSDDLKYRYFISETNDQAPVELQFKVYYKSGVSFEENTFLKQLLLIGKKYNVIDDSFQWDIDHADYNKQDILKLTSKINGISKGEYIKKYSGKAKLNFFAGAALNSTTTRAGGSYQLSGGKNYTSNLPAVSAGINFFANPNTGKLIFRAELIIGEDQYKSAYLNKVEPYIPINYTYNQFSIAITPQLIYNFYNADNLKIYGGLGLPITFYTYSNKSFTSQDGKTPSSEITQNNPFNFDKFSTPAMFKAGIIFGKKWGVFADYILNAQACNDNYFQLNFSTFQAGVNYFFR